MEEVYTVPGIGLYLALMSRSSSPAVTSRGLFLVFFVVISAAAAAVAVTIDSVYCSSGGRLSWGRPSLLTMVPAAPPAAAPAAEAVAVLDEEASIAWTALPPLLLLSALI